MACTHHSRFAAAAQIRAMLHVLLQKPTFLFCLVLCWDDAVCGCLLGNASPWVFKTHPLTKIACFFAASVCFCVLLCASVCFCVLLCASLHSPFHGVPPATPSPPCPRGGLQPSGPSPRSMRRFWAASLPVHAHDPHHESPWTSKKTRDAMRPAVRTRVYTGFQ